jgi:anhydro-N-acetylmuramic acid kinase
MPYTQITGKQSYTAIGVMSGTSADGLDLALCRFERFGPERAESYERPAENGGIGRHDSRWHFEILKTKTISYSGTSWPERLAGGEGINGFRLMELHRDFGRFTGKAVNDFLSEPDAGVPGKEYGVDLIASHGHTVFHRPERGITLQIGDGAEIASATGIMTISDFRRLDVALGGQGAPLVPAGDELLFGKYGFCLNLGGFANISFRESGKRVAFDICPVNIVLNRLALELGKDYDKGGEIARSGKVIPELLENLENIRFYKLAGPRSLGREWLDEVYLPVLGKSGGTVEDKMRTVCEHIALRVSGIISASAPLANTLSVPANASGPLIESTDKKNNPAPPLQESILVTGGGARNDFLMKLIGEKSTTVKVVIPDEQLVDFKEAVVFAFLGVMRLRNEINCLSSVTGASRDSSGGTIHLV